MKIYTTPFPRINNSRISFGSSTKSPSAPDDNRPELDNKTNSNKPLPEWARKSMLGVLIFFAFKNDPNVQNLLHPYEPSQEDLDKIEFFDNIQTIRKDKGKSSAFYQINNLSDIEVPKIKSLGNNAYSLEFELDSHKINMEMLLDKNNKDTITGRIKLGEQDFLNYKAIFSPDDIHNFKVIIKDKNDKKYLLGRDSSGELYQIRGGKKFILNSKNVQRYEEHKQRLEELEKFRFFTNENDFWRKANLVILIYLVFMEMLHDRARRKMKEKDNNQNPKV